MDYTVFIYYKHKTCYSILFYFSVFIDEVVQFSVMPYCNEIIDK